MLIDLLFPRSCLGCSKLGVFICERCRRLFVYVSKDTCLYCGGASLYGYTHPGCQRKGGIDGVMSVYIYASAIKDVIKEIKYRYVPDAFPELFLCLYDPVMCRFAQFRRRHPTAALQPMPLHVKRLKERGFNQSAYLARFFSSIALYGEINGLRRHRSTRPQAQIQDQRQRSENMKNAFSVVPGVLVQGKTIILVDDVITSGSTVKEAAKTFKAAGAETIFAWSLARG